MSRRRARRRRRWRYMPPRGRQNDGYSNRRYELLPPLDRCVVTRAGANVNLARAGDLLLGVAQQLGPLRQPADRARDGEQHREHLRRQLHGLVDDTRVEIDVRVQLTRYEVLILQRDSLQLDCDIDQRVATGDLEDIV